MLNVESLQCANRFVEKLSHVRSGAAYSRLKIRHGKKKMSIQSNTIRTTPTVMTHVHRTFVRAWSNANPKPTCVSQATVNLEDDPRHLAGTSTHLPELLASPRLLLVPGGPAIPTPHNFIHELDADSSIR